MVIISFHALKHFVLAYVFWEIIFYSLWAIFKLEKFYIAVGEKYHHDKYSLLSEKNSSYFFKER